MSTPSTLWIIHREQRPRAVLARIAGAGENTILGSPTDELFNSASPPDVILLAPSGDFESELEFVHRFNARLPHATWILLPEAGDLAETRRLFDSVPAVFVRFPPHPDRLRRRIYEAVHRRETDPLSRRHSRERLATRFARWFADQSLPELIRALDPGLSHIPLLIRGERGTGRTLLARYVHAFGSSDTGPLRLVPCAGIREEQELIALVRGDDPEIADFGEPRWTILLEDVHELPPALQNRVRDWVAYGLPPGALRCTSLRWIATADDEQRFDVEPGSDDAALRGDLAAALSGMVLRLPPLRERLHVIEPFVSETVRAWCNRQGQPLRDFAPETLEELQSHPWPGNMDELETLVLRTLAFTSVQTIAPRHLRFQHGDAPWSTPGPGAMFEPFEPAPPRPSPAFEQEAEVEIEVEIEDDAEDVDVYDATMRTFDPEELGAELEPDWTDPFDEQPGEFDEEEDFEFIEEPSVEDEPLATTPPTAPPEPPIATPLPLAPASSETATYDDKSLRRLIGVLAHEVRNPLVSIRTFSELLPENFDDAEFRTHFAELVGADVKRIEAVVAQLQSLAQVTPSLREPVDIAALLDMHLDARRTDIHDRSLLVLKELDRNQPYAFGDRQQLSQAFSGLVEKALSLVPERGDIYIASKHNDTGLEGRPSLRVLMRYHNPGASPSRRQSLDDGFRIEGTSPPEASLDFLIAELVIRAQGGLLTLDTTDAQETVIVVDLPAPPG